MRSLTIAALILIFLCGSTVPAKSAGTHAAQILLQSIGARALASGEAFVAVSNDIQSLQYNPAGLGYAASGELSGSYIKSLEDSYYSFVGYVQPIGSGAMALGFLNYDGGLIEINEQDGSSITLRAQQDYTISLGGGWRFDSFPDGVAIGMTLKLISSTLAEDYTATAYAMDLGVFYPTPIKGLDVAFAIQNIGTSMNYFSEYDPLPLLTRFGASYKMNFNQHHSLRVSMDRVSEKYNSGLEYSLGNIFLARIGYKLDYDLVGLTYGFGLCLGPFKLDYAFGAMGDLGGTHLFSLTIGNTNY